jgi:hypothetical protein
MKVVISKCYLIQIDDKEGNEIKCEYFFGTKKEADQRARELKEECKEYTKY